MTGGGGYKTYPTPFLLDVSQLAPETAARFQQLHYSAVDVSMIRLIANPKQFDGQSVRVVGVLSVGEHGTVLYSGREAYEHSIGSDAIFIGNTFTDAVLLARFSGHYVQVTGEFDAKGVAPPFAGQLHDVLAIVPVNVRLQWRQLETELAPANLNSEDK